MEGLCTDGPTRLQLRTMNEKTLIQMRLTNQLINAARPERPEDVVRWMGALQAQDYGQAVWAVGLRMQLPSLAAVEQAVAERWIIRTWPQRGTIHFILPEEARWRLALSAKHKLGGEDARHRQLGLEDAELQRSLEVLRQVLQGGRVLPRPDILAELERAGIFTGGQRGYHILWVAARRALICLGPLQGRQPSFTLLDEWVPGGVDLSFEQALTRLAAGYFASHGPATLKDLVWWAGLRVADARTAIDLLGSRLEKGVMNGKEIWWRADAAAPEPLDEESVYLLPGFDEYLLGYTNRSAVLELERAQKVVPGGNGVFRPLLVTGGRVTGTWQRSFKKNGVAVSLFPFDRLPDSLALLEQAVQGYCDFLGKPLQKLVIEQPGSEK